MDTEPWTGNQPVRVPFPVPRGRLGGWLSGRLMLAVSQQEVADLLDVPPGSQVLEVGYGSGALLRCLRQSPGTERHELENMTAFTATRPAG
jgi:hypothetical protein